MTVTFAWDYGERNPWASISPGCPEGHSSKFVVAYDVDDAGDGELDLYWKCHACSKLFRNGKTKATKQDSNTILIKKDANGYSN